MSKGRGWPSRTTSTTPWTFARSTVRSSARGAIREFSTSALVSGPRGGNLVRRERVPPRSGTRSEPPTPPPPEVVLAPRSLTEPTGIQKGSDRPFHSHHPDG